MMRANPQKGNTVFILLNRPAAVAIVFPIKSQFLSLYITDGIWHEKCAFKAIFYHSCCNGLRAKWLRVKKKDAAAFGGERHVTIVPVTCDVNLNRVLYDA